MYFCATMMALLYIDPGSTSYIVQAIAAGALGFILFFKNIWYGFLSIFKGKKKDSPTPKNEA